MQSVFQKQEKLVTKSLRINNTLKGGEREWHTRKAVVEVERAKGVSLQWMKKPKERLPLKAEELLMKKEPPTSSVVKKPVKLVEREDKIKVERYSEGTGGHDGRLFPFRLVGKNAN